MNIKNYFNRKIESHSERKLGLMFVIVMFNLILFGYFGIYTGLNSYLSNRKISLEYSEIINNLENNIQVVNDLKPRLESSQEIIRINTKIPSSSDIPEHLTLISEKAAQASFSLVSYSTDFQEQDSNKIRVTLNFEGPKEKSSEFVSSIESLDRLTHYDGFAFSFDYGQSISSRVSTTSYIYFIN